jgi:hypothetical protein
MNKPDGRKANADDPAASDLDLGQPTPAPAPAQAALRPAKAVQELDDLSEPEFAHTQDFPEDMRGWNGAATKVALAYPLMRDHTIVGPGSPCMDCRRRGVTDRTHQFHIQASRDRKSGEWSGPEAGHYQALKRMGHIAGSPQAAERQSQQNSVDHTRGIFPSDTCRQCGRVIERNPDGSYRMVCPNCGNRNGLPELAAWSTEQMQRVWRNDLAAGRDEAIRRERQASRSDVQDLRKGQIDFVNLLRMGQGLPPISELPEFPGAQAPGTRQPE